MSKSNSSKKRYWFIKRNTGGLGFGALMGYPNTWQGTLFWIICFIGFAILPQYVDSLSDTKGLGGIVIIAITFLVWFPVTAIKTEYITDENKDERKP